MIICGFTRQFMLLMRKTYLDSGKNLLERESALLLYFRTLLTVERLKGEEVDLQSIINEQWLIDRPTITRIAEDAISEIFK